MSLRLSPKARYDLSRIVPFGVIWLLLSQVFLVSDYAATGSFAEVPETAIRLDPAIYLFASVAVLGVGLLVGAIEVLFLNERFSGGSFTAKLLGKTAFYGGLLAVVMLVTFPIAAAMEMETALTDPRVWGRVGEFMVSKTSLGTGVQLTTSLVVSLFYFQIGDHMGPRVLTQLLSGRYHDPKSERRVFLFSDMKSSTRIAERLGHGDYFELLRAYYDALAGAIVDHAGEVYQYVGDEVVVSWPAQAGLREDRCIRCVLQMKRDLRERAPWFEERFGVAPDFKAGMQLGEVTTGEIGALKKDIVFTGDLLNQAARLQALSGELGQEVLLGAELRSELGGRRGWSFRSMGRHVLRGREKPVEVFALEASSS